MSLISWREIRVETARSYLTQELREALLLDVQDPPVHWPWLHGPIAPERAGMNYIEHAWRVQAKEDAS